MKISMKHAAVMMVAFTMMLSLSNASAKDLPYTDMRNACKNYLNAVASPKDLNAMGKKLMVQVETKQADQGSTEEEAMSQILLDWAAGNAKRLEAKDKATMIQASYYFVLFVDKGYSVPGVMEERMTVGNMTKWINWLNEEAAKNGKTVAMK